MPRETTRQSTRQEAGGSHMEMEIRQTDQAVWVALSGILDRVGVDRLVGRVAPQLHRNGVRIVLDGSRLTHLDYRATSFLLAWNRKLRSYGHQLYLHGWSDYLKAILVMEDWDTELGAVPRTLGALRHSAAQLDRMP
jgi:ABC-type transporter Mla MlaB component